MIRDASGGRRGVACLVSGVARNASNYRLTSADGRVDVRLEGRRVIA